MIRIDGFYLYTLGANLKPISDVKAGSSSTDYFIPLYIARASLDEFLHRSVFQPKVSFKAGSELLATLTAITDNTTERELNAYDAYRITNGLTTFENVFNA